VKLERETFERDGVGARVKQLDELETVIASRMVVVDLVQKNGGEGALRKNRREQEKQEED
jgi:hypothetical protein